MVSGQNVPGRSVRSGEGLDLQAWGRLVAGNAALILFSCPCRLLSLEVKSFDDIFFTGALPAACVLHIIIREARHSEASSFLEAGDVS